MPRTCQWPTGNDIDPVAPCGTTLPSFTATATGDSPGGYPDTMDICDKHVPDAETTGYTIEPYG